MISWSGIGEILIRDGNHPKSIRIEPCSLLLHPLEVACVEQGHVAIHRVVCASRKHLLDGTFADQKMLLFLSLQNHRHSPPLKIEGQLVDFFEAMLELDMFLHLDMVEHGNVQQVF